MVRRIRLGCLIEHSSSRLDPREPCRANWKHSAASTGWMLVIGPTERPDIVVNSYSVSSCGDTTQSRLYPCPVRRSTSFPKEAENGSVAAMGTAIHDFSAACAGCAGPEDVSEIDWLKLAMIPLCVPVSCKDHGTALETTLSPYLWLPGEFLCTRPVACHTQFRVRSAGVPGQATASDTIPPWEGCRDMLRSRWNTPGWPT